MENSSISLVRKKMNGEIQNFELYLLKNANIFFIYLVDSYTNIEYKHSSKII